MNWLLKKLCWCSSPPQRFFSRHSDFSAMAVIRHSGFFATTAVFRHSEFFSAAAIFPPRRFSATANYFPPQRFFRHGGFPPQRIFFRRSDFSATADFRHSEFFSAMADFRHSGLQSRRISATRRNFSAPLRLRAEIFRPPCSAPPRKKYEKFTSLISAVKLLLILSAKPTIICVYNFKLFAESRWWHCCSSSFACRFFP